MTAGCWAKTTDSVYIWMNPPTFSLCNLIIYLLFFLFLIYMMLGSQLEEKQVGLFPFVRLFFYVAFSQLSTSYKPPQPILPSLASISRAHLMPPTAASYVTVWWLRSLLGSAALSSLLAWERNEEYDCASACPPASSLGVGVAAVI